MILIMLTRYFACSFSGNGKNRSRIKFMKTQKENTAEVDERQKQLQRSIFTFDRTTATKAAPTTPQSAFNTSNPLRVSLDVS